MPDVTIINDFNEDIHIAFFLGVPTNWKNYLKPGERWTCHLGSLPLHFEARWVQRVDSGTGNVWRSREFGHDDSTQMLATIGGACAAGTASVVSAFSGVPVVSGPLMLAASAGGTKYDTWSVDVRLFTARVWVPFWNKRYSVRMVEGRGCVLWDVDANRPI